MSIKENRLIILALSICVIAILTTPARAQQKPSKEDLAKAAATEAAISGPGPEHKRLAALEGNWDQEVKLWMAPGQNPLIFKGTVQNKMILGGRFLQTESKFGGEGFQAEALLIMGFDRRVNQYTEVDFDSEGTYYVTGAGPFDSARNAIVLSGEETQPGGATGNKFDTIITVLSPDKYRTEIMFKKTGDAAGFKVVEINCTRAR
jgi:hypothetical protein